MKRCDVLPSALHLARTTVPYTDIIITKDAIKYLCNGETVAIQQVTPMSFEQGDTLVISGLKGKINVRATS